MRSFFVQKDHVQVFIFIVDCLDFIMFDQVSLTRTALATRESRQTFPSETRALGAKCCYTLEAGPEADIIDVSLLQRVLRRSGSEQDQPRIFNSYCKPASGSAA